MSSVSKSINVIYSLWNRIPRPKKKEKPKTSETNALAYKITFNTQNNRSIWYAVIYQTKSKKNEWNSHDDWPCKIQWDQCIRVHSHADQHNFRIWNLCRCKHIPSHPVDDRKFSLNRGVSWISDLTRWVGKKFNVSICDLSLYSGANTTHTQTIRKERNKKQKILRTHSTVSSNISEKCSEAFVSVRFGEFVSFHLSNICASRSISSKRHTHTNISTDDNDELLTMMKREREWFGCTVR